MTSRIWITRTQPAAERSAANWAGAGFEPIIAPLLTIEPLSPTEPLPEDAELIFTSAHGVRHCGIEGDARRVYAVGESTADAARDSGFTNIVTGDGNWSDLLDLIVPTDESLVHVSGKTVRGRIVESLIERGMSARRHIVYESRPVTNWPIEREQFDVVALYSPMASETLMSLPEKPLDGVIAYCLSENVAAPLRSLDVRIAAHPNQASMIACSRDRDT